MGLSKARVRRCLVETSDEDNAVAAEWMEEIETQKQGREAER